MRALGRNFGFTLTVVAVLGLGSGRQRGLHRRQSSASGRPALRRCKPPGAHSPEVFADLAWHHFRRRHSRHPRPAAELRGLRRHSLRHRVGSRPRRTRGRHRRAGYVRLLQGARRARGLRSPPRARQRRSRRRAHGRGFVPVCRARPRWCGGGGGKGSPSMA
jgi:hypothetical protein